MATQIDVNIAAVGALAVATRIIEALVAKQLLTEREGLDIYELAFSNMGTEADCARFQAALQGLMPGLVMQELDRRAG